MIGNVREWTQDCWSGSCGGAPADGQAWETGDCGRRVVRDGSWNNKPGKAHAAYRNWCEPALQFKDRGFRLARTL